MPRSRGGSVYAYYADLGRGYGQTMSAEVMDAVAHALRLTEEEREAPSPQRLRLSSQQFVEVVGGEERRNSLIARQAFCWLFLFECVRV
ncbi:hypothetical protein [Streptomyces collinus]|uniref:hypothetical protein n=1 Tax=Streptomyces collinus TaxID=42684 RepID=UPI00381FAFE3